VGRGLGSTVTKLTKFNDNGVNLDAYTYLSLNAWTFVTSMVNVLSHFGVALGLLDDALIISILAGVGIDILTRLLQLIWWIYLHSEKNTSTVDMRTVCLLCFLSGMYYYHMEVHVRALYVFLPSKKSVSPSKPLSSTTKVNDYESIRKVLSSALNNLQGIPGQGYRDHLFAYTDLGSHLLACLLSLSLLLDYETGKDIIYSAVIKMCVSLSLLVTCIVILTFPFQNMDMDDTSTSSLLGVHDSKNSILRCSCIACKSYETRKGRKGKEFMSVSEVYLTSGIAAFTFNPIDGVCRLWFKSFGNLQAALCVHVPETKGCKLN